MYSVCGLEQLGNPLLDTGYSAQRAGHPLTRSGLSALWRNHARTDLRTVSE